jgi:hypothetical protein
MHPPFSLRRRSAYPWWFGGLATAALVGFFLIPNQLQSAQLLLSIIGGIAAFFHFLYSQHNSNTDRFIKLFQEFNARFDKINDHLNRIYLSSTIPVSDERDLQALYDYFNLCAEEYLYFKSGYIDREVWNSWLAGMRYFAENPEIRRVWQREVRQGSYYGFTLKLLETAATPADPSCSKCL